MDTAERILREAKTIAVVGLSRDPAKTAHAVPRALQSFGYRVIPVNPHVEELLGERSYPTLDAVPDEIDVVEVFRPSADAPEIARQTVAQGAKALWLQQGIVSAEARRIAEEGGVDYVEDQCMAVARARFGIRSQASSSEAGGSSSASRRCTVERESTPTSLPSSTTGTRS